MESLSPQVDQVRIQPIYVSKQQFCFGMMFSQVKFREVGTTGVFMAYTKADQEESMGLLKENGF